MCIVSSVFVHVYLVSKLVKLCIEDTKLCLCLEVTLGDAIYTQSVLVKLFLERWSFFLSYVILTIFLIHVLCHLLVLLVKWRRVCLYLLQLWIWNTEIEFWFQHLLWHLWLWKTEFQFLLFSWFDFNRIRSYAVLLLSHLHLKFFNLRLKEFVPISSLISI